MNIQDNLKGFTDDTWLNGIGSLFRKNGHKNWGINLSVYPFDQNKTILLLSQAPITVRKNVLRPTKNYSLQGETLSFNVENAQNWEVDAINNCPAWPRELKKEAEQLCFVVPLESGTTVFIPQFEMARALFFKNVYLSRSCLDHGVLDREFGIEYDEHDPEHVAVHVREHTTCADNMFKDYSYRRFLAWVLLDPEARRSYESISQRQLETGKSRGLYRIWDFQFEPPSMNGARLKVRGNWDRDTNTFFVYEVSGIENIAANVPEEVDFVSPKFFVQEPDGGSSGGSAERAPEHEVEDESGESKENYPVILQGNATTFEFAKPFNTRKTATKTKSSGSRGDGDSAQASSEVSTEEQGPDGNLASADWDGLDDQTEDTALYESRFASFFKMLEILESAHDFDVVKLGTRKLPKVGRCNGHTMRDDSTPRVWTAVKISFDQASFYLLEVDMSDAAKPLSTKVVNAPFGNKIIEQRSEFEARLLKNSLNWPKAYLDEICGADNHSFIVHPKTQKAGEIAIGDIERWAANVRRNLLKRGLFL
ncbi:Tn7-like element transposition protein TnsE [Aliidiomarina maris]|uniref:TnsE C-terminal domain-containing protein n=1 Tax=Aliidiomarina maris TaxID=531312 RepID=A0A327WVN4_9GAMM|nr:Tn7-like element transposition protein TnsE [Aliidiomarina maris]RAJ97085.1 hypothetical protein B0I24_106148 [Aliidiomarina maris]